MTLITGSKLGPYEILGPLGAGGMGEVYRARDTRLGREVALKVLPESFSRDADRLRRSTIPTFLPFTISGSKTARPLLSPSFWKGAAYVPSCSTARCRHARRPIMRRRSRKDWRRRTTRASSIVI